MSKLESMTSRPRSQTIGAMEGVVITPVSPKPRPAESPKSPPKFFLPVSTCKRAKLFGRGGSYDEDPNSSSALLSTSAPAERHFPPRSFSKSVCVMGGYNRHKRDSATSGTGTTSSNITGTGISLTVPGTERLGEEDGSVEFQDYEGEQSSSDSRSAEDSDSDDTEVVDLSHRIQIHNASGSATPHFGLGQVDDPVEMLSGAMNNLRLQVHNQPDKVTYHASPLLTCALDNTRKLSLAAEMSGDSGGFKLDLGEAQHQLPKLPASLQFHNVLAQGKAPSEQKRTEYSKDLPYDETIIEEV